MNVLITGVNGFIGVALHAFLLERGYLVQGTVRSLKIKNMFFGEDSQIFSVGSIDEHTDWREALGRVDVVVHLAARVHALQSSSPDQLTEYRRVNILGTERLARQAAEGGVKRFVYLSSIKVNGEETGARSRGKMCEQNNDGTCFSETDIPNPQDPYALSKWEAEKALQNISQETGMELVLVRPPLVYGPGVQANFLRLLQLVERGLFFLPLKSIVNQRSMVYLGNLVDLIAVCIEHPNAAGETFLVSDGEDLSTPELIRRITFFMSMSPRLVPCPAWLLRCAGKLFGKKKEVDRLCGSLQVDISKAKRVMGWQPKFSVEEGLRKTVDWYRGRLRESGLSSEIRLCG